MNWNKLGSSRFLIVMVGIVFGMAIARAEEPALNVTAPEVAPILDPVTNAVTAPVATNAVSSPSTTNVPPLVVAPVVEDGTNSLVNPPVTNVPAQGVAISETGARRNAMNWQVGTRYTQFKLDQTKRGTRNNESYFGSITGLNEEQDQYPNKVYAQGRILNSFVWIGISYDHVRAETMDYDDNNVELGGDGSVDVQGAIPYVQAAWDIKNRVTPFIQVGYAFYQAKFEPNSWAGEGLRHVDINGHVSGIEFAGGLNIRIYKNLSADLFAKVMKIDDIKGEWYSAYGAYDGGPVVLPMSYTAYGAGLNWRF